MNNPLLPSFRNNDVPFLDYDSKNNEEKFRLLSLTNTIMTFLLEETKMVTQLFHEWVKLSARLTNQQAAQSYLIQRQLMNSILLESVKNSITDKEDDQREQGDPIHNNAESDLYGHPTKEHMRILFLTWEFPPHIVGGLARHVHGLTKSLADKGHEIHVITAGTDWLPEMETIDGVIVHRVKPLSVNERDFLLWIGGLNIAIAEKAALLTGEKSFDCIHSHDWLVGAAAIALKKNLELPLITTIHATEYGRNHGIFTEMQRFIHNKEKKLVELSDQVVVCSDYMEDEVKRLFKPANEKLVVIPNGIDCERNLMFAQEEQLADVEISPNRKMIFSIGRMVKEKGFETLIEAAAILKGKGVNVYFIIAGKGPMLEEYRKKVTEMQLTDTVRFIGFIDDEKRNALLEHADMAVFPSLYEPFGIVALEAMQAGKPTIVSNTGGLKGIVDHLETGMLVEPGNSEHIAEQIVFLIENPELAGEIGKNGRVAVQSRYSWDLAAEATSHLYNKILHTKKHHR